MFLTACHRIDYLYSYVAKLRCVHRTLSAVVMHHAYIHVKRCTSDNTRDGRGAGICGAGLEIGDLASRRDFPAIPAGQVRPARPAAPVPEDIRL